MTLEQRQTMGIFTQVVTSQQMADEVIAPGEVMVNRYHTTEVAPRITAQIIRRHARMGEQIKKGQKLVTLSSVEMAEAQGQVLMEISDESRLWVEAKLAAKIAARIEIGTSARVSSDEHQWVGGKVVQIHRRMDETTRTLAVRIELDSTEGWPTPRSIR